MIMLRAMVLGWLGGLFTPIHERVLYPSHHPGGEFLILFSLTAVLVSDFMGRIAVCPQSALISGLYGQSRPNNEKDQSPYRV